MTKLVDLYEEGSITNDETGWFMWRRFDNKWKLVDLCEEEFDNKWRNWLIYEEGSITNDETGWFIWRRFDNKWWNWLIYMKKVR